MPNNFFSFFVKSQQYRSEIFLLSKIIITHIFCSKLVLSVLFNNYRLTEGTPVSGPRSLPSLWFHVLSRRYSLVLSLVLSKVLFLVLPGEYPSQDRIGGYPPSPGQDRGTLLPRTGEQVMLCHGQYTSCSHAGTLSCFMPIRYKSKRNSFLN